MAWVLDLLCCFRCPKQEEQDSQTDETTHLIPSAQDYDLYDASLLNQRRLDERLGGIIRSKEGKMVNVSSHLPFNLHNRALPEESFPNSRSGSRSIYHAQVKEHNHDMTSRGRQWSSHEQYPIGDPPTSAFEQRPYSRSPSQNSTHRGTLRREPILNVKLVGYESPNRGRSMRPEAASLPDSERSPAVGSPEPSNGAAAQEPPSHEVQFADVEDLLCTSWGD